jgi:NAD(P)-dependent dehydrogenase (short-subunit alcohol dehydrogenase family)
MNRTPLCIVAGVGPGMGAALVKRFAREGFNIAMLARQAHDVHKLEDALSGNDIIAKGYAVDLGDFDTLKAVFSTIQADFGPCNVLVYNAAQWRETLAMAIDARTFNRDLAVCVTSALLCAQLVYSDMKKAGGGTILFTGGGLALYPEYGAGVSSLTAGKSGLRGLAYVLAKELASDNIHVGLVTIAGKVTRNTPFDPDRIAKEYWTIYSEAPDAWTIERVFDGK